MAIAFVSSTESQLANSATNPRTVVIDIGTPTDPFLIVPYVILDSSARTVSSATWNGAAMTKIVEVQRTGTEVFFTTGILYIHAPATGSNTLSVTLSGAAGTTSTSLFPMWASGAHQSAALDDSDSLSGSTDPSLTLDSTEANTLAVAVYFSENNSVITSDQGTEYQNHDFGAQVCAAKYIAIASATSQVLSWSGTDDDFTISAANFKSVAGGGGGATPIRYQGRRSLLGVG